MSGSEAARNVRRLYGPVILRNSDRFVKQNSELSVMFELNYSKARSMHSITIGSQGLATFSKPSVRRRLLWTSGAMLRD